MASPVVPLLLGGIVIGGIVLAMRDDDDDTVAPTSPRPPPPVPPPGTDAPRIDPDEFARAMATFERCKVGGCTLTEILDLIDYVDSLVPENEQERQIKEQVLLTLTFIWNEQTGTAGTGEAETGQLRYTVPRFQRLTPWSFPQKAAPLCPLGEFPVFNLSGQFVRCINRQCPAGHVWQEGPGRILRCVRSLTMPWHATVAGETGACCDACERGTGACDCDDEKPQAGA